MGLGALATAVLGKSGNNGHIPISIDVLKNAENIADYKPSVKTALARSLKFAPDLEAKYQDDAKDARIAELRLTITIGVLLYNLIGFTDSALLSDLGWWPVFIRFAIVSTMWMAIVYYLPKLSNDAREIIVALAVAYTTIGMVAMTTISQVPEAYYGLATAYLGIIFGTTVFPLSFSHAWKCTVAFVFATTGFVLVSANMPLWLYGVLGLQLVISCVLNVLSVYRTESIARGFYLLTTKENYRLDRLAAAHDELKTLSDTDALTGVSNRGYLDRSMAELFASAASAGRQVTLLLADVDHFKRYNDHYGHQGGDDCLIRVAHELRNQVRGKNDIVARYGGEEFAIVLMDLDIETSEAVAERICAAVETLQIAHGGRRDGTQIVTISVGAASVKLGQCGSVESFFKDADLALYEAKRSGRNQAVLSWRKAA